MQSFAKTLQKEEGKINILFHKKISPGDGGIAGGQVALLSQTNK